MATVSLLKPKGEAIGFKVSNDVYEQITQIVGLFNDYKIEIHSFRTMKRDDINSLDIVIKVDDTLVTWIVHGDQYVFVLPNHLCENPSILNAKVPFARNSLDSIEINGPELFDYKGQVFESAEEVTALLIEDGNMVDTFKQVYDWCNIAGNDFETFKNDSNGYSVVIDGCESEPLTAGDYLFFNEYDKLCVYSIENLKSEGYEVNE